MWKLWKLAIKACRKAGLSNFRVELGQVRIGREALRSLPLAARNEAASALSQKDGKELERILKRAGVSKRQQRTLTTLVELFGDPDILRVAKKKLKSDCAKQALDELEAVYQALLKQELEATVGFDLGELRGHAYIYRHKFFDSRSGSRRTHWWGGTLRPSSRPIWNTCSSNGI